MTPKILLRCRSRNYVAPALFPSQGVIGRRMTFRCLECARIPRLPHWSFRPHVRHCYENSAACRRSGSRTRLSSESWNPEGVGWGETHIPWKSRPRSQDFDSLVRPTQGHGDSGEGHNPDGQGWGNAARAKSTQGERLAQAPITTQAPMAQAQDPSTTKHPCRGDARVAQGWGGLASFVPLPLDNPSLLRK